MAGRCETCGFDPADFDRQDTEGTFRSWSVRWEWTLEGIGDAVLKTPGPAGLSAMDHRRAHRDGIDGPEGPERLHVGEHHLYAAGRVLQALGAGAPTMTGAVDRINSSDGGVPKRAIDEVEVAWRGLVGDRQASRKHHGRPSQAVSLWAAEMIESLAAEGHPIGPGLAGENITVRGVDWASLRAGSVVQVGEVLIVVTGWADPCSNLRPYFTGGDFRRIDHGRHPGVSRAYASVLRPGRVRTGDAVIVEP
jgi:MOSC domain-containing protein YiiM